MQKFCSNCGAELKEGAHVCLNCGQFLKPQVASQSVKNVSSVQKSFDLFTFITSLLLVLCLFVANANAVIFHAYMGEIDIWTILFSLATIGVAIPMLIFGIKLNKTNNDLRPIYLSIIYLTIPFIYMVASFISLTS